MVQSAAADGVAHPSDRSIAWEEKKGGSSSGPESEGLWPQCPPPSPEQMSQTNCTPLAQAQVTCTPGSWPQPYPSMSTLQPGSVSQVQSQVLELPAALAASCLLLSPIFQPC